MATALVIIGATRLGTMLEKVTGQANGLRMRTWLMQVRLILTTMAMKTRTLMMQKKAKVGMLVRLCTERAVKTVAVASTRMVTDTPIQPAIGT